MGWILPWLGPLRLGRERAGMHLQREENTGYHRVHTSQLGSGKLPVQKNWGGNAWEVMAARKS